MAWKASAQAARAVAGHVSSLLEIAAVPPRMAWLDTEAHVRPGDVDVYDLARRQAERMLPGRLGKADLAQRVEQVELESALGRT